MHPVKPLALALLFACAGAMAQIVPESPDWRESAVPPPPAFELNRLIGVESPKGSTLTFGIDPATVSTTPEGVVRYVIVATGPGGGHNVMYEGIRCSTAEHKVYARYHLKEGWSPLSQGEWQPLYGSASSRHALKLSLAGVCKDRAVNRSAANIVRALKGELPGGYD